MELCRQNLEQCGSSAQGPVRSSRRDEILHTLSGRGVMTADQLASSRVWVAGPRDEALALGSLQILRGPEGDRRVLGFLGANPDLNSLWVEQGACSYPPGMDQCAPNILQRILFCNAPGDFEDAQWAVLQGLRSGLFQAVILRVSDSPLVRTLHYQNSLRRFRVEVERAQALVWVLEQKGGFWVPDKKKV